MRIALFSDTYLPQVNGVATHVKTLKEGLEQIGHTVLVVTADASVSKHIVVDGVLRCPAVTVKRLYGYSASLPRSRERNRIIDEFAPDIVHIHTEFGIGRCGEKTAKRLKIPMIYTLHTMWDQYLHYIFVKPFIPVGRKLMYRYIGHYAKAADEIIGPSIRVQEFMERCKVHRAICEVPNAVEVETFDRSKADAEKVSELRKQYHLTPEESVICFCGRLGEEKSIDTLIAIFASDKETCRKWKLMIIGNGPMLSALQEQVQSLGLTERVIFTGAVPHAQVRETYACCDFFATASKSEVNSISMLEAMAMGLPVLHIVDEENPGQVNDGVNGRLYRTAEEFHAILREMENNPEERRRLQASAAESVRALGQASLARKEEEVYRRAIENKKR